MHGSTARCTLDLTAARLPCVTAEAFIGNFVFNDSNVDGLQSAGEAGVVGVVVKLLDGTSGLELQRNTTGSSGVYSFEVDPGTYRVSFERPPNFAFSPRDRGDDALDSDALGPEDGRTPLVTVASGARDYTLDAGVFESEQG